MAEITEYQSPHVHMHKERYVLIVGNPSDGYLHYGPFDDTGIALEFLDKVKNAEEPETDWHIANLWIPKLSEKP